MDRDWRQHAEVAPHCPRCGSSNTKFCYYNNYSLTQPRYFCKGCRRYWTKGGSLRNVPVGGGCRKNRRGRIAAALRISGGSGGGVVPSRSTPNFGSTECNSYNQMASEQCSSSSAGSIDLAAVYANFLNQRPENGDKSKVVGAGIKLPELPNEFDIPLSMDFSGFHLPEDHQNGIGCIQGNSENLSNNVYGGEHGGGSHETSGGYGGGGMLAPLPGEEILWSNSHVLNQTSQEHDSNLLLDNWSPFDLSSDDTFSRSI